MRGWSKNATAVLLVAGLTACAQAQPLSAADCRSVWEGLRQTQAENGSTAPEGSATAGRWQEEYDAAQRRARKPGDLDTCAQDVVDAAARFSALADLGTAVTRHDLRVRLQQAERDLRHARDLGSFATLPRPLADAFDRLRSAAPAVHEAVARLEAGAADVDLDDRGDVKDLVSEIEDAATSAASYDEGRKALEVIGRYELHEE